MNYREINENQRSRMYQICESNRKMKFQDPDIFDVLMGNLPQIKDDYSYRGNDSKKDITREKRQLNEKYLKYNSFITDKKRFISDITTIVNVIKAKQPYWDGIDLQHLKECVSMQRACLISGEGGIGKSYFISKLENELENKHIPHLCLYGKFKKDMDEIDISEISVDCTSGFVFIVDAVNEMSEKGQKQLIEILKEFRSNERIRIIATFRSYTLKDSVRDALGDIIKKEYQFPGVSFESALQVMIESAVPDVYKYDDVLYSHNALFLNMLCDVFGDGKRVNKERNGINSVTFIIEHYIKKSIKNVLDKKKDSEDPKAIWECIKILARIMYRKGRKFFDEDDLSQLKYVNGDFIEITQQAGIISKSIQNGVVRYDFCIDTLADYIIARSMFDDISGQTHDEQIRIIKQKSKELYTCIEEFVIVIFDKLSPDYKRIFKLLKDTDLLGDFRYETVLKINFKKDEIGRFQKIFNNCFSEDYIIVAGGYVNKPFNCINYLNAFYNNKSRQIIDLTHSLSGIFTLDLIKSRLKNIIYFITTVKCDDCRVCESLDFGVLCSAAPNVTIRALGTKLMYEIIYAYPLYISKLIERYDSIIDYYIKESIVFVLSKLKKNDQKIKLFFNRLMKEEKQLSAKSIKRISEYIDIPYGYILWNRENLLSEDKENRLSKPLKELLNMMDVYNPNFMPFTYWGDNNIHMSPNFIDIEKTEIMKLNKRIVNKYKCVMNGECNGSAEFEKYISDKYKLNIDNHRINPKSIICSWGRVNRKIFGLYNKYNYHYDAYTEEEFKNSVYMKCIDISIGLFYGSIMCNYYTDQFATYNNARQSIGFEEYDPFEYDEEDNLAASIPKFDGDIEQMGDEIVNRLYSPEIKDEEWCSNAEQTQENLLKILQPVKLKEVQWVILSCRVAMHGIGGKEWKENYDLFCCTRNEISLAKTPEPRYLTIEVKEYQGSIDDYHTTKLSSTCRQLPSFRSASDVLNSATMLLPPADIVNFLKLKFSRKDTAWLNESDDKIILCDCNAHNYYENQISDMTFIRKDYLDKYMKDNCFKYFAFSERYVSPNGYADETSCHYEIQNGVITNIKKNYGSTHNMWEENLVCRNCEYGLFESEDDRMEEIKEMQQIIDKNGYTQYSV